MTHQICDACECVSLCSKSGCRPLVSMSEAPKFAIPPSSDVTTLRCELSLAYDLLARERMFVKELAEALRDMNAGWKYIRSTHGDLYGVGWDRAQDKADAALSKVPQ